jgi:hypothetical protein
MRTRNQKPEEDAAAKTQTKPRHHPNPNRAAGRPRTHVEKAPLPPLPPKSQTTRPLSSEQTPASIHCAMSRPAPKKARNNCHILVLPLS